MTAESRAAYTPEDQAKIDVWRASMASRDPDRLLDDGGNLPPLPPKVTRIWTIEDYAREWPNGLGKLLQHSAISIEVADARGYDVLQTRKEALNYGFMDWQVRRITDEFAALLVPIWDVTSNDSAAGWQLRPAMPDTRARPRKYETPNGQANFLDVNPLMRGKALDPTEELWITEGARKVDALATLGVPCIGLAGVWNWRGKVDPKDAESPSAALPQWDALPLEGRTVVICFDSDVKTKKQVRQARRELAAFLISKGALVEVVHLPKPADGKTGIDDYLGAGGALADLKREEWVDAAQLDGRPVFRVDNPAFVYDSLERELGGGALYGFFRRQGVLVHVPLIGETGYEPPADGDDGPAQVRPVSSNYLRAAVQSRCFVCKEDREEGLVHTLTPPDPFRLAVEVAGTWASVPGIEAVTHTPLMRADGTILTEPGYDAASRTLFLPDAGLQTTPIPEHVDDGWVSRAVEVLDYLLCDFPFENEESKANMLALLLTPLLRLIIPPPYPLMIMNAHQPGSGKTLLATIAGLLHGGVHRPELPQNDEELRKQVSGILATTTAPVVVWDNATAIIKSPVLSSLLTTATWNDRLLGSNKDLSATNDRCFLTTGNNIDIGGDMARRCYWVTLDPATPEPEKRTGFHEPNLERYVEQERGRLLTALLVLARSWVQRGMPKRTVRSDSYGDWAGSMAELVAPFGLTEPFCEQKDAPVTQSADDLELAEFLRALVEVFDTRKFQVREVEDALVSFPRLAANLPSDLRRRQHAGEPIAKSLGWFLRKNMKRYASGLRVRQLGRGHGGNYWQVERS